jgi:hypothetical protein
MVPTKIASDKRVTNDLKRRKTATMPPTNNWLLQMMF